ncbi:MAG: hypothetical protein IT340_05570 [Chloroflexi bacterium]|nr:hypothetical protein [Chloroflexota bacterium]
MAEGRPARPAADYGLQAPSKPLDGGDHPDRDAQFHYIAEQTTAFQAAGQPVIPVDTNAIILPN